MGSFRPVANKRHLHRYFNFTELLIKTVPKSLNHSGIRPYTSSYDFAESCVFVKQSLGPFHCDLMFQRHSLSLSYGAKLPSSLTKNHSITLGYSPRPPVSVYGTVS